MQVIIMGSGRNAYFLGKQFASKGYYLTIIAEDEARAAYLSEKLRATVVVGDGSQPEVLRDVRAELASIFVALRPHDEDNLIACQIAKQVFGISRTIALVNDPDNEAVFKQLGVSVAVSAVRVLSLLIEEQAGFEEISNQLALADGRITVSEIALVGDSPVVGRVLREMDFPTGALIAAVMRSGEVLIPNGNTQLKQNDKLVVISQPDNHGRVVRYLTGEAI
jgi:trk system potassium uptake protein